VTAALVVGAGLVDAAADVVVLVWLLLDEQAATVKVAASAIAATDAIRIEDIAGSPWTVSE
jgi:hypothetical protein